MAHRGPGHSPVSLCLIFLVTHSRTVIRAACSHFSHNHVFQKALAGSDSFLYFLMRDWLSQGKDPLHNQLQLSLTLFYTGQPHQPMIVLCSDCTLGVWLCFNRGLVLFSVCELFFISSKLWCLWFAKLADQQIGCRSRAGGEIIKKLKALQNPISLQIYKGRRTCQRTLWGRIQHCGRNPCDKQNILRQRRWRIYTL